MKEEISDAVRESFAWAFFTKKMKYTDKLVYADDYPETEGVSSSLNDAEKEPRL